MREHLLKWKVVGGHVAIDAWGEGTKGGLGLGVAICFAHRMCEVARVGLAC